MKNVQRVQLGRWEMDAWYFSPYPEEFTNLPMLYLCPFCLEYFPQPRQFERHRAKCTLLHPPGNEIYYDGTISFWEVDGKVERRWCRNLSLLSKLFLDHKTVYFDVDPFWYYVMTISDEKGHTVLGYFSKEKESSLNYNLACILTLPCHQRKGYGKLLIAFSYLLSLREGKVGSPEKPLSDLGLLSYLAYWSEVLAERLVEWKEHSVSLEELSHFTGMTTDDVTLTLKFLDALRIRDGRHVVVLTNKMVEIAEKALVKKNKSQIHPDCLHWVPPDARARVGAVAGEVRGLGFGIQQAVVGRSGADEWAKPVPRKGYTEAGAQR
ncbi:hypothetical protein M427DRAFT_151894 [Gonapodya prolifera JEL478]|uniref:histone acetyltransferase n=1 Tax=Gonapodya prolifera (strain JEL478) TaxID=1344416 RepID=A0A139AV36_GONPJ|nr:hypothetical protein M427DRAFT_151894 [Gonapodya prolifera JEL478]|eukprot:KXS20600.1 hypothetical protein M427DRAFT_151894 [Gonapodya prolifera JEL478]